MTVWITHDGKLFSAATKEDLVEQLRKDTITQSDDAEHFMTMMADWTMTYNKAVLDTSSAENFVDSLMANDLLTKMRMN